MRHSEDKLLSVIILEGGNMEKLSWFQKQDRRKLVQGMVNRPEEMVYGVCYDESLFRKFSKLGYTVFMFCLFCF